MVGQLSNKSQRLSRRVGRAAQHEIDEEEKADETETEN